jgi:hypothetical protein
MNLTRFKSSFEGELNFCVKDNWIKIEDVNDHRSSKRSELHSKIIALLSYTLQQKLGYYLEHNLRPWGGFSPDIIVFSKKIKKYYCEAIIEYESPNSYLHYKGSHVGKDLEHFFEFNRRLIKDNGYLSEIRPAVWLRLYYF